MNEDIIKLIELNVFSVEIAHDFYLEKIISKQQYDLAMSYRYLLKTTAYFHKEWIVYPKEYYKNFIL